MASFLPQTAEYALRAMVWFATHSADRVVPARDLSLETGIPSNYLSKILRRLVLAGILESRRGPGGGFQLARPPKRVSFRDVLLAVDAYPEDDHCAFGWGSCSPRRPCPLHEPWSRLSEEFRHWACSTTLADLSHGLRRQGGTRKGRRGR